MSHSICLAMNVKNEARGIERCIRSCAPIVDKALIIDTGSEDDTMEIVSNTLRELGLPFEILESEWVSHGHNRSYLLRLARERGDSDFILQPDADMELVITGPLPDEMEDAMKITIHDRGLIYPLPLLTRTDKPFYYAGPAHVYLACEDNHWTEGWAKMLSLIDHGGGGHRPGKIERDAELLAAEIGKNPMDRRSWYYYGQSHRDLGNWDQAMVAFQIRANMGGWDEEVYNALLEGGKLVSAHKDAREGLEMLLKAWQMMPHRAEALRAMAAIANSVADKLPVPENDVLFVMPHMYKKPDPVPFPDISPGQRKKPKVFKLSGIAPTSVSAIVVTRGNVDLEPCLEPVRAAGIEDIVIWDNSKEVDYKVFGRYAAIPRTKNPVIYWQDDDIIFENFEELFKAYEPGVVVGNMDQQWIEGTQYPDELLMVGAGSLCDADIPASVFAKFLEHFNWSDDVLVEADFAFGILADKKKRVDLGYIPREFADAMDRLYQQPGQTERKWTMIMNCMALRSREEMAAA